MKTSYKRFWKRFIDKDMKNKELMQKIGISSFSINKLNRGKNICKALSCTLDEFYEFEDHDI